MNETLKLLYDRFYTALPIPEAEQEVKTCHQQLIERLFYTASHKFLELPLDNFLV